MNELALFAGAGGGILGGKLLGWETVCAVERDAYAAGILAQRQNDGCLSPFPIWSDITTFDGKRWRGRVGVISGGFPCQDLSVAGTGEGLDGGRSGLWGEMSRVIGEVRPEFAYIENSPMLTLRGLDRILCDLAAMGFNAQWGVISAAFVGADHKRERIWIVANNAGNRLEGRHDCDSQGQGKAAPGPMEGFCESKVFDDLPAPDAFGAANGLAHRMDRLKAIGNGQVPQCAAEAFRRLRGNL